MTVKSADQITLIDLTDGYSVMLSNDSHVFQGNSAGFIFPTQSTTTTLQVLRGSEELTNTSISIGDIVKSPNSNAIHVSYDSSNLTFTISIDASLINTDGSITIPVNIDGGSLGGGITINKVFTFSIAPKGDTGEDGVSIVGQDIAYAVNNSPSTIPQTGWVNQSDIAAGTATMPTTSENEFLWTRTIPEYSDDRVVPASEYVYSVAAHGASGTAGKGISKTEIAFAISASATSAPTGTNDWIEQTEIDAGRKQMPVATSAKPYLWTRTVITYTDTATSVSYSVSTKGDKGEDSYNLEISSSNGLTFKNAAISTTLTATIFKGGEVLTPTQISSIGTIKWYKDGSSTAEATTGSSLPVTGGTGVTKIVYVARLESNDNSLLARNEVTLTSIRDISGTYIFYDYTLQTNTPNPPTSSQVAYYIEHGVFPSGSDWEDSEPDTIDVNYNLYRVEVTHYSDNTLTYSIVTKDSSYEAAKAAKTVADAANNTANSANTTAGNALNKANQADEKADDAVAAIGQVQEIITGTQSSNTRWWVGISSTLNSISDGTTITYWLPRSTAASIASSQTTGVAVRVDSSHTYEAGVNISTLSNENGDSVSYVWLNLTFNNGTSTGWIPCYYGATTRLTTHYAAGNIVRLVYRENASISGVNYTGWWADANYDSNNYDRLRYNSAIKAAEAITKSRIICGTASGYKNIGANISFDLSYPLLYAVDAISSGNTNTNTYLNYAVTFSNNGTIESGLANKILYLKGTVAGNIFTIASTNFLTTVEPTFADGYYYIPLGTMTSSTAGRFVSSNRLFAYIFDSFQAVDVAAYISKGNMGRVLVSPRNGAAATSLLMKDASGYWASLTVDNPGVGTNKSRNTDGLYIDTIYYNINKNAVVSTETVLNPTGFVYNEFAGLDFRYSSNCGNTLTPNAPLYLIGELGSVENTNLFYLDPKWWTQNTPNKSSSEYSTSSTYELGDLIKYTSIITSTNNSSLSISINRDTWLNSQYFVEGLFSLIYTSNNKWVIRREGELDVEVPLSTIGVSLSGTPVENNELYINSSSELYTCIETISSGEAWDPTHWGILENRIYLEIGIAINDHCVSLSEKNAIYGWNKNTGFREYTFTVSTEYSSELNKLNNEIQSRVTETTFRTLKENVDSNSSNIEGMTKALGDYKEEVNSRFSEVSQKADRFSVTLYGTKDYDGSTDPETGVVKDIELQKANISALQKNVDDSIEYIGMNDEYPKLDYFNVTEDGVLIGSSNSQIMLVERPDEIYFMDTTSKTKLMRITTKGMESQENVIAEQINMFNNWAIRKGNSITTGNRTTYNLNDVWTGG